MEGGKEREMKRCRQKGAGMEGGREGEIVTKAFIFCKSIRDACRALLWFDCSHHLLLD